MIKERRHARRLALDALYQAEIRGQLPLEAFSLQRTQSWMTDEDLGEVPLPSEEAVAYATALVAGIQAHSAEIDERIVASADRWALDRMALLDKNLLRIAVFELIWMGNIPVAVVINEAIELAKSLSTQDSGSFINGILGRIAEHTAKSTGPDVRDPQK